MASLYEYLYHGTATLTGNTIDWILKEDGEPIENTPTRFILTLTHQTSGAAITVDSNDAEYDLAVPGTTAAETFQYATGTATLTIDLRHEATSAFATGTYLADLDWYDAFNTQRVRWGRDTKYVVIED